MATIDTRPATVDLLHYAGDSLTIQVRVPTGFVAGREWSAQVRSPRDSGTVEAEFVITETADGAFLFLSAEVSRELAGGGVRTRVARKQVLRFSGEWDVQLTPPGGGDPTITLAQGKLTIDLDVTREDAP